MSIALCAVAGAVAVFIGWCAPAAARRIDTRPQLAAAERRVLELENATVVLDWIDPDGPRQTLASCTVEGLLLIEHWRPGTVPAAGPPWYRGPEVRILLADQPPAKRH